MARPFSIDLRERVVSAVVRGGVSCRGAARRFGLGASTAVAWVSRFRRTGSAAPGRMDGHKRRKIAGAHECWLRSRIGRGDFTLMGLVSELAEQGLVVDYHTVWNFVHEQGFRYKKNAGCERARAAGRCVASAAMDKIPGPHRSLPAGLH